jgi:hypothetical protein
MRHAIVVLIGACCAAFGQEPGPPAPPRTSFQGAVNAAVDRGVAWLRSEQQKDGAWKHGHDHDFPLGTTALCTLALLKSDVPSTDAAIQRALERLEDMPLERTYSTGVLLMVLEALGQHDRHREWARRGVDFLVKAQHASGLWAYPDRTPDLSNSQFAIFGLFAASRMGIPIPHAKIERFVHRATSMQGEDGGFPYTSDLMVTGSMTGAGVASLLLCRQLNESQKLGLKSKPIEAAAEKGFGWLARRFRADQNPAGPSDAFHPSQAFYFYYLYAVERAAVLGGRPKLGDHDWYRAGAVKLIRKQSAAGHWEDAVNTCFALLFLKRASLTYSPHAKAFEGDPKLLLPIDDEPAAGDEELKKARITGDVPFLRHWVVLGPFQNLDDTLLNQDLINEAKILPYPTLRTGRLEWKEWRSEKDFVDFDLAISQAGNVVGHAACYLWSDADADAILWFGSDEGAKVTLNRETILYEHRHDRTGADASRVRVRLKQGRNVLIVKVEELRYHWGFHARLTDMSGAALPLKVTVRPEK